MGKGGHSEQPKPASLEDMQESEAIDETTVENEATQPEQEESNEASAEEDKSSDE